MLSMARFCALSPAALAHEEVLTSREVGNGAGEADEAEVGPGAGQPVEHASVRGPTLAQLRRQRGRAHRVETVHVTAP